MLNFMRTDIKRMFQQKSFYITQIIGIFMILLSFFLISRLTMIPYEMYSNTAANQSENGLELTVDVDGVDQVLDEESYNEMMEMMQLAEFEQFDVGSNAVEEYSGVLLFLLFMIFFVLFITDDFRDGYLKNILSIQGMRLKWLGGKMAVAAVFIGIQMLLNILAHLIGGLWFGSEIIFDVAEIVPLLAVQFLLLIAFAAVILTVLMIFQNRTATIITGILLTFNLQGNLFQIVDSLKILPFEIEKYGLMTTLNNVSNQLYTSLNFSITIGVCFLAAALFISYNLFSRRDLKV